MKKLLLTSLLTVYLFEACNVAFAQQKNNLEIVSTFPSERPGNIAVSPNGRVFVTMSALGDVKFMVKEILPDGRLVNFPDDSWIVKPKGYSQKGINSTIGIQVSSDNILWVLDMGNKNSIPKQAPKLVGWNLNSKKVVKVFPLQDAVLRSNSFLQDFVIDEKNKTAVIADMTLDGAVQPALPAFVVIDMETGFSRRVLENHTTFEPVDQVVVINGRKVSHTLSNGSVYEPRYPLNPISIDKTMKWIYYGAMGGNKIFRIPASSLANEDLSNEDLSKQIEFYANKPKTDGFKVGDSGEIYVTDVENNAIGVVKPNSDYKIIAQSEKLLSWPDGVAISQDGYLYIVANQLQNLAWLNNNKDVSSPPYYVLRIKIK